MKIYKTLISFDDEGKIYKCDTIRFEGKFWLVSRWLDPPGTGNTMPERIVLLDALPHQKMSFAGCDFLLRHPIPKAVLYGEIPSELKNKYVVIDRPRLYPGCDSIH